MQLHFNNDSFSKIFPYFIFIDENLKIKSFGKNISKIIDKLNENECFLTHFSITRPNLINLNSSNFHSVANQLIIISNNTNSISLRGQFEPYENSYLFVGSPWFSSIEEFIDKKLTVHDFAHHDPQLDFLHILKNQDINNSELKELLEIVNNQRKELKKDKKELIKLSLVAKANNNGVVLTNSDGTIFWCNPAYLELTGFTFDEIIGKTPFEIGRDKLSNTEDINKMISAFHRGESFDIEIIHAKKSKQVFWSRSKGQPILDSDGKVIEYFAIIEDITQEKTAAETLLVLSSITEQNTNAVIISNKEGEIEWVNSSFINMSGYTFEESIGKKPGELLHGDETNKDTVSYLRNQIEKGLPFNCEICNYNKKGQKYWVRMKGQALYNKNGEIIKFFTIEEDITQERYSSQQLIESENRLTTLIVNLETGILLVDQNKKIVIVNKKLCSMFGIKARPETLKGTSLKKTIDYFKKLFKNPDVFTKRVEEILSSQKVEIAEEIKLIDGRVFERNFIPISKEGKFFGHLWSFEDITFKKRYRENLESEKEKYRNIIANMKMGLLEVDNEDKIQLANLSFCEMSGFSLNDLLGQKASDLLLFSKNKKNINEKIAARNKHISDSYEVIIKNKEGQKKNWFISGAPNYNDNGEVIGSIGVHLDITEQKRLEKQKEQLLNKLEKQNEQLNEYAQIVSHDLKSPLRSIHSLITWIKEDNAKEFSPETFQYLNMIEMKVEKMDHLIQGILTYSKIDNETVFKENVNLNNIVNDIVQIIHFPKHIHLSILNKLPVIKADKFRMQQLFQNIIDNAINYIDKPSGKIEIDYFEENNNFVFSIKDNGPGIAEEYQDKIFKIFKSFTQSEKSTGIGLSIVKRIVDNYRGKIWIESKLDEGTTFYIQLPKK